MDIEQSSPHLIATQQWLTRVVHDFSARVPNADNYSNKRLPVVTREFLHLRDDTQSRTLIDLFKRNHQCDLSRRDQ